MLVLTRRPGESIVIGNDVVVSVVEVRGDQVRIGIQAPRSVGIHREEVFRQLEAQNAAAAASAQRASAMLERLPSRRQRTPGAPPPPRPTPRKRD